MFVQSPEDLEQVPVRQVGDIQSVRCPDPREHVANLHLIDSDEVMQTRQIGDEVISRFEAEDFDHEIFGDVLKRLDTCRRRAFNTFALEGPFAED